tara:strand:+ start:1345 stop:1866 length:522 start_codon:yes stop_codon:yes gene_type:complete
LKKIFFIILVFLTFEKNFVFSDTSIKFIDVNYIYQNSKAGKKINEQIKDKSKKMNKKLEDYKKNMDNKKKKLASQKNVISEEVYKKTFIEIENEIKEINSLIAKDNQKIIKFTNDAKITFLKELNKIMEDYSIKNSIDIIIKKENILIGKNSFESTKEILEIFDKKVTQIKVK